MQNPNAAFVGSVPDHYERHLRHPLFEPYAADLAARYGAAPGARVLEIACGTGVLTRRLLDKLPPHGRLTATDLNQAMLDCARRMVPADPRLHWRTADAQALPFGDACFDAVVIQFGVMFFPDKIGAFREAKRVLAPGGRLLFNSWAALAHNGASAVIQERLAARFPDDTPGFLKVPFGYFDAALIRADLEAAGLAIAAIEELSRDTLSPAADDFAAGIAKGTPLSGVLMQRGEDIEMICRDFADALAARFGAAPMRAPMRAWVVEARRA